MTAALLLAVGGGALLYLASPNQRLLSRPLPARPSAAGGVIGLGLSLAMLLRSLGTLSAVFTFSSIAMLVLVTVTYAGAIGSRRPR